MRSVKIAISLASEALRQVDQFVQGGLFPSRSKLIQDAVTEKLQRLGRVRLARECAKLQISAEQDAAEEFLQGEVEWPSTETTSAMEGGGMSDKKRDLVQIKKPEVRTLRKD
jgi:Arc/MetJ-type ribon-helix-helix transcriptional regulator